jgi:hypothetical protein
MMDLEVEGLFRAWGTDLEFFVTALLAVSLPVKRRGTASSFMPDNGLFSDTKRRFSLILRVDGALAGRFKGTVVVQPERGALSISDDHV